MSEPWIGVDLDGTLAEYESWNGDSHVGKPISLMVDRVKKWLAEGICVKIFTARIAHPLTNQETFSAIESWCQEHIGQKLEITCKKDYAMLECWDDRSVQVIPNTGKRADGNA